VPVRRLLPPRATAGAAATIPVDFGAVRRRLEVPDAFPPAVLQEAERVAADPPGAGAARTDRTDLALVTIDPVGSKDLDQAMCLERSGSGYRVFYAIADLPEFVVPGGAVDSESHARGETLYSPDLATPLHPPALSEGAASLQAGQTRPAVLWCIDLDDQGERVAASVERATVRSVARLDYVGVQADVDAGTLHDSIALLPEIGRVLLQAARRRDAIDLAIADAEVVRSGGHWTLALRDEMPVEQWNAQISLLTGMTAAALMLEGGVGLLRTLPPANEQTLAELRRSARVLHIDWPADEAPGDLIARLDPADPVVAAFLDDAVHLLRGAGYTPFDGAPPAQPLHAGVGSPYAHVTAPLRRLADRYAAEICLALHAGRPVPDWVRAGLDQLPSIMSGADRRAGELERACVSAVVVFVLSDRIGETFPATVLQIPDGKPKATVLLHDPPVRAQAPAAGLAEGDVVQVRLTEVQPDGRLTVEPLGAPVH
jgi:exoribonuclease R